MTSADLSRLLSERDQLIAACVVRLVRGVSTPCLHSVAITLGVLTTRDVSHDAGDPWTPKDSIGRDGE